MTGPQTPPDLSVVRRRLEVAAMAIAAVAFGYWLSQALREPVGAFRIDVRVYQAGARALVEGRPLYEPVLDGLYFTYPPFAALVFAPMTLVDDGVLGVLWVALNLALIVWTVGAVTREAGGAASVVTPGASAWFAVASAQVIVPLADTVWLGQINIVLMALVVADLIALNRGSRWAGLGIGIAAGIKLTPLLFIVLLLAGRRWRAAAVATGTFASSVLVGLLILPANAVVFWTDALRDTGRIARMDAVANQSLHGVAIRLFPDTPGWAWVACAVAACAIAVPVAIGILDKGRPVLAAAVVGMASALAAPFSWEHHWTWLAVLVWWPLCAALGARGWRRAGLSVLGVATLLVAFRWDRDGRATATFAFGGDDVTSWWTASYPVGALLVIFALAVAGLVARKRTVGG